MRKKNYVESYFCNSRQRCLENKSENIEKEKYKRGIMRQNI